MQHTPEENKMDPDNHCCVSPLSSTVGSELMVHVSQDGRNSDIP
jgi:hypothetical protein